MVAETCNFSIEIVPIGRYVFVLGSECASTDELG